MDHREKPVKNSYRPTKAEEKALMAVSYTAGDEFVTINGIKLGPCAAKLRFGVYMESRPIKNLHELAGTCFLIKPKNSGKLEHSEQTAYLVQTQYGAYQLICTEMRNRFNDTLFAAIFPEVFFDFLDKEYASWKMLPEALATKKCNIQAFRDACALLVAENPEALKRLEKLWPALFKEVR